MATWIRFVNEGEVEANEEIAELVRRGAIEPSYRPEWYLVLDTSGISWEMRREYEHDVITWDTEKERVVGE